MLHRVASPEESETAYHLAPHPGVKLPGCP
jgi:hypothetical protein